MMLDYGRLMSCLDVDVDRRIDALHPGAAAGLAPIAPNSRSFRTITNSSHLRLGRRLPACTPRESKPPNEAPGALRTERSHDVRREAQNGHEAAAEDRSSSRREPPARGPVARSQRDVGRPRKYAGRVAERRWCQRVSMRASIVPSAVGDCARCHRRVMTDGTPAPRWPTPDHQVPTGHWAAASIRRSCRESR